MNNMTSDHGPRLLYVDVYTDSLLRFLVSRRSKAETKTWVGSGGVVE